MSTQVIETQKKEVAVKQLSQSERFTNAVMQEFSRNNREVQLTEFQKNLIRNYFIKIDQVLKDTEKKRLAKSEQYREALPYTWNNVNMSKLAIDSIAYSSVELDPAQPNHIYMIPYKNTANNTYDMGFIMGYRGMEIKATKYGLDIPDAVVVELVYSTDIFKQIKKDINNKVEGYVFEIVNDFDRGEVVGGFWYHSFFKTPEKNKLRVYSKKDIDKRKPKKASPEFWGGKKDVYENGKRVGVEEIEGWYDEMAYKTVSRAAYNAITIDSRKIDDNYLSIIQKEKDSIDADVQNELLNEANKELLDFPEEQPLRIQKENTVNSEPVEAEFVGQVKTTVEPAEIYQPEFTGPGF